MSTVSPYERMVGIMRRLRAPGGCPWDREQTLESLRPFLIEETYEVLDAMLDDRPERHQEELGDLFFQIVFQSEIRSEREQFGLDDVLTTLADKLTRRHPHVFKDGPEMTREEVRQNWDRIKAEERGERGQDLSSLAGVPRALPALLRADRLSKKAAAAGFDWQSSEGVLEKVAEEIEEVKEAVASGRPGEVFHEVGDLLLAVANLGRHLGVEPETALQAANSRFEQRFRVVESLAEESGSQISQLGVERLEELWQDAKVAVAKAESDEE